MNSDWPPIDVGAKLKLISGFPFPSNNFSTEGGFPLIRIRDVTTSSIETYYVGKILPEFIVTQGDVLVGMDGDFNIAKWRNSDALLNQRVLKIAISDATSLDPEFIFYWLQPYIQKINDITAATTVKHLSTKDISKIQTRLPSIEAQHKIGLVLCTIDQAIEKSEALIKKYQQIKAGLMHDLFTRGIGADGKLRPPREEAPELYQQTVIGWIPKDWSIAELGQRINVIDPNPSHRYPTDVDDGIPICSTENFSGDDGFDFRRSKLVPFKTYREQISRCNYKQNDVVFARKGRIGMARRYGIDPKAFSHTVVILKPHPQSVQAVCADWILWISRSQWLLKAIEVTMNTNSGVPTLGVEFIKNITLPFPPTPEQEEVDSLLMAASLNVGIETDNCAKLKKLKSGLMQDLLTGKVTVNLAATEQATT